MVISLNFLCYYLFEMEYGMESMQLEEIGEYVIQIDTEGGNPHERDYVIKNPDTKERDTHVPPQIPQ